MIYGYCITNLAGENDCVVDAKSSFDDLPSKNLNKYYSVMNGATHCQWSEDVALCEAAEILSLTCPKPTITESQQENVTAECMILFFQNPKKCNKIKSFLQSDHNGVTFSNIIVNC